MKYILKCLAIFILFPNLSFAQERIDNLKNDTTKLFVEYIQYKGYTNDSTFLSAHKCFLFLGKKAAISVYQSTTPKEYLQKIRKRIDDSGKPVNKDDLLESLKKQMDVERIVSSVYARYYNSPVFYELKELDKKNIWMADTLVFKWTLMDEFKTIQGYRCQRAERINSKGEHNTAWFTEEIPYSSGPLIASGLPGLILEFSNPEQKSLFRTVVISSTDVPEQRFRTWLDGPIVTKSEYREIYTDELKRMQRFKRMMENQKNSN